MLCESGPAGIEPATCKSQVQRPTAKPPHNTLNVLLDPGKDTSTEIQIKNDFTALYDKINGHTEVRGG